MRAQKERMRYLFIAAAAILMTVAIQSCGHSASLADDRYTETIFWEDEASKTMAYGEEEMSDSELIASEEAELAEEENPAEEIESQEASADSTTIAPETNEKPGNDDLRPLIAARGRLPLRRIGRLHELFNDSNHYQLEHARRLGVDPMSDPASYYNTRRPLEKIETNKDFVVDELRHSYPYLVPEAAQLLHDIGRNFQDSLASRNGGRYRIIVTSVLRTPTTVKRLRRVNGNATQESTHQYGTTFDITYTRFNPAEGRDINSQEDLKNLLAEVLLDLREQGRCMVKYERKSPCFHITVVK